MDIKLVEHGVMLPDYFGGTPGVMLPIYISEGSTVSDVLAELRNEINMIWDHIGYVADYHGFEGDLGAEIDQVLSDAADYVAEKGNGDKLYCSDVEFSEDEHDENPVAIFSLEFEGD